MPRQSSSRRKLDVIAGNTYSLQNMCMTMWRRPSSSGLRSVGHYRSHVHGGIPQAARDHAAIQHVRPVHLILTDILVATKPPVRVATICRAATDGISVEGLHFRQFTAWKQLSVSVSLTPTCHFVYPSPNGARRVALQSITQPETAALDRCSVEP